MFDYVLVNLRGAVRGSTVVEVDLLMERTSERRFWFEW
jgi:hypothetical protein